MTPLILAASAGKVEACHILISKGALVNSQNDEGHSGLQYAASKGWTEVSQFFFPNTHL
jgi:26S proteasome non-ATPase regulatory subunit 10